jgi:hypothetical protein
MLLSLRCGFLYVAPLRFGFCLSRFTSLRFFLVAPLRCAKGLRQQGVVPLLRWTA